MSGVNWVLVRAKQIRKNWLHSRQAIRFDGLVSVARICLIRCFESQKRGCVGKNSKRRSSQGHEALFSHETNDSQSLLTSAATFLNRRAGVVGFSWRVIDLQGVTTISVCVKWRSIMISPEAVHTMKPPRIKSMNEALEILRDMGLMWRTRWVTVFEGRRRKRLYAGIEFKSMDLDFRKLREVQDFYDYHEIRFSVDKHFEERLKFTASQ
jgi:hypothetical protein